jgi:hypothetical protein
MAPHRWLLVTLALSFGCHRTPAPASVFPAETREPEFPQGIFYYEVKALGEQFRGRIVIVDTTVIFEPDEGTCAPRQASNGYGYRRAPDMRRFQRIEDMEFFACERSGGNVMLAVDRRWPMTRSEWGRVALLAPQQRTGIDCMGPPPCTGGHTRLWSRLDVSRDPPAPPDSGAAGAAR